MSNTPKPKYPKIGLLIDGEWIYDRPAQCDVENPSDESIIGTSSQSISGRSSERIGIVCAWF